MEFRIVVWNLHGLSHAADPARLQLAAKAFRTLAEDKEIAAFALVELGTDSILEYLGNALGPEWMPCFGAIRGGYSENGLLLNTEKLSATTLPLTTDPYFPRGRTIKIGREPAAVFQVNYNMKPAFLIAVVHFKAEQGRSDDYTRKCLAAWLRTELEQLLANSTVPVVIVGDFNGEPYEEMFGPDGFCAFRRADAALRSQGSLKLYNPMWRLLPDQHTVTARRAQSDDQPGTPYGTFLEGIWHSLIDGVIVSSEWLNGQRHVLHDNRLEILTDPLWHHIGAERAHHTRPMGMTKQNANQLAISDHLPIAVNLEIL